MSVPKTRGTSVIGATKVMTKPSEVAIIRYGFSAAKNMGAMERPISELADTLLALRMCGYDIFRVHELEE